MYIRSTQEHTQREKPYGQKKRREKSSMRGRKRLRKKLKQKIENTPKIVVQLDCCSELNNQICTNLVERFQLECLNPIGLLFEGRSTDNGWSGTVNPQTATPLSEKHRESIADWLFQQHEICDYAVSRLSV
jgi:uncharacterized protein YggL (DUF469 family)